MIRAAARPIASASAPPARGRRSQRVLPGGAPPRRAARRPRAAARYETGGPPRPRGDDRGGRDGGDDGGRGAARSRTDDRNASILRQMRSVPNVITMTRIASTPLLSFLIVTERFGPAVCGCVVFGFSDWLDGYVAKNYEGQATVLGTFLDPIADKVIVNAMALSLCYVDILPAPIVGLWLARDVGLIVSSYCYVASVTEEGQAVTDPAKTPLKIKPTTISKVNTALQFATISAGMAQPLFGVPHDIVLGLCWITAGTTIGSGLSYVGGESLIASGNKSQRTEELDRRGEGKKS